MIHDDLTRIVVFSVGLVACLYATYRIMRGFNP